MALPVQSPSGFAQRRSDPELAETVLRGAAHREATPLSVRCRAPAKPCALGDPGSGRRSSYMWQVRCPAEWAPGSRALRLPPRGQGPGAARCPIRHGA